MAVISNVHYGTEWTSDFMADYNHQTYVLEEGETRSGDVLGAAFFVDDMVFGVSLLSNGTITGGADAVFINELAHYTTVYNGPLGVMTSPMSVITSLGLGTRIVNKGLMKTEGPIGSVAVTLDGSGSYLKNTGTIKTQLDSSTGTAVSLGAEVGVVENIGLIKGFTGVLVDHTWGVIGATVANDGKIAGVQGIVVTDMGINTLIENSGEVTAEGVAIKLGGDGSLLRNSGTVTSLGLIDDVIQRAETSALEIPNKIAVYADDYNQVVINSGKLDGDVYLGDGFDAYMGRKAGIVTGRVFGDGGSDRLIGSKKGDWLHGGTEDDELNGRKGGDVLIGAEGADDIYGGGGADEIYGDERPDERMSLDGSFADFIDGGAGDDVAYGGLGDDTIHGGSDDDKLYGDEGDDTLMGDAGDDVLLGGEDNDYLQGGADNDKLSGQAGDDTLMADAGNDKIRGGDGADIFAFADWENDLGKNKILDFEDGIDLIDLSFFPIDDLTDFVADAVTAKDGNAVINLKFADTSDLDHYSGKIIVLGAAGLIDEADFVPLM